MEAFFRSGKTLPIERGGGVDQPVMALAAGRVAAGDWVHVFPEGRIHQARSHLTCQPGGLDPVRGGLRLRGPRGTTFAAFPRRPAP